jgi:transposase-like protein
MKELSVGEQRYQAVMAVLSGGRTVTEVARDWEVSRQTMHAWLARYEREGMEGMGNRSHRPTRCSKFLIWADRYERGRRCRSIVAENRAIPKTVTNRKAASET